MADGYSVSCWVAGHTAMLAEIAAYPVQRLSLAHGLYEGRVPGFDYRPALGPARLRDRRLQGPGSGGHRRLANLGMHEIALPEGALRGHSFHYSRLETPLTPLAVSQARRGHGSEPAYRLGSLLASYLHLYFPSNPRATARLFAPRPPTST